MLQNLTNPPQASAPELSYCPPSPQADRQKLSRRAISQIRLLIMIWNYEDSVRPLTHFPVAQIEGDCGYFRGQLPETQ